MPLRTIHTQRGKASRAEPVSALFEQGRAHIVGTLEQLEDQLCTFAPGSPKSPDRLDAMVYAALELTEAGGNTGMIEFYARMVVEQDAAVSPLGGATIPAEPSAGAYPIRTIAPEGTSTVMLITGRSVTVGVDRIVMMSVEEA